VQVDGDLSVKPKKLVNVLQKTNSKNFEIWKIQKYKLNSKILKKSKIKVEITKNNLK